MPLLATPLGMAGVSDMCDCLSGWYFFPVRLIAGYAFAIFVVYIVVPAWDIYQGVRLLFCNKEKWDEIPAAKLTEQLGEAVPQLTIAVTFYCKNWHWLPPADCTFGVLTMTMSAGSILIGLVTGCMARGTAGGLERMFLGNF